MFRNVTDYWAHRDLIVPTQCVCFGLTCDIEKTFRLCKRNLERWAPAQVVSLAHLSAYCRCSVILTYYHCFNDLFFLHLYFHEAGRAYSNHLHILCFLFRPCILGWLLFFFLLIKIQIHSTCCFKKPQECWYSLAAFVLLTATVVILCFRVEKLHCLTLCFNVQVINSNIITKFTRTKNHTLKYWFNLWRNDDGIFTHQITLLPWSFLSSCHLFLHNIVALLTQKLYTLTLTHPHSALYLHHV